MKFPTSMKDLMVFSRIVGAALLICGYLLAGLYAGRWCVAQGYPQWTLPLCLLVGLAAAALAGWHEIRSILAAIRKNDGAAGR
ncbi:MAG: hypothetical protein ACOYD9_02590 [Pyramidobacter sp.]|jgi:4-hydroxybenzoate polyprenyltransferase